MSSPLIAVTGIGMVTALGRTVEDNWSALKNCRHGLGRLTLFPSPRCSGFPVAQVPDNNNIGNNYVNNSRTCHFAVHAARCAFDDAGLQSLSSSERDNIGIVMGICTGGMFESEYFLEKYLNENIMDTSLLQTHSCAVSANTIADLLALGGARCTVSSACASGTEAITVACDMLISGQAQIILAGGADSLTRLTVNGFCSLLVVSPDGCRPFDANRNGMNLGEGAAVLVLETLESARRRCANIYAYVAGWNGTSDAFHETMPLPDGQGIYNAMMSALEVAQLKPDQISYINAHGTGTIDNDLSEGRAILRLFGDNVPLVSSTKRFFGHTLAAAGAIEAIVCILAIKNQTVPANLGFQCTDPQIGLTPVTKTINAQVHTALSNSIGFGGNNSVIILTHPQNK